VNVKGFLLLSNKEADRTFFGLSSPNGKGNRNMKCKIYVLGQIREVLSS